MKHVPRRQQFKRGRIMRFLFTAVLALCCGLSLAETGTIKSLTAEQAAELVATHKGYYLYLNGLTSIQKNAAQELAKFWGGYLYLNGLASIENDVAQELAKYKGSLELSGLRSIDKDVADEFAKFQGYNLTFLGLKSVDKSVLEILKSNPSIRLPKKYRD